MFKIGEFAQIGRVTGRQLRHYERLGLLQPQAIDPQSGYRYYSAAQLPRLNRILALKSLGFSLEQVGRLLDGEISPEELRGMLSIRKAQVEQTLTDEEQKLRQIESRIRQIEEQGALRDYEVTLRRVPSAPFLSLRKGCADLGEAIDLVALVVCETRRQVKERYRNRLVVIAHSDFEGEALDLEIGITLTEPMNAPVRLPGALTMTLRELEEVDSMACLVRAGPIQQSHLSYGALGIWMESNGYQIDGLCREVFLEVPSAEPSREDTVVEIQFPVRVAV